MSNIYSTTVLFEYPLNEKMRIYLKLEFLLQQLYNYPILTNITHAMTFFYVMNDLLDILEHHDIRREMLKELDHRTQKLKLWEGVIGVDSKRINILHTDFERCANILTTNPRPGQILCKNHLITTIRQRLSIPGGGYCSFNIPILHIWLNIFQEQRNEQVNNWLRTLEPLNIVLTYILQVVRNSSSFKNQTSAHGFFQDHVNNNNLLRLRIPTEYRLFPQVSGYKTRYAIHFISLDNKNLPDNISFELACC